MPKPNTKVTGALIGLLLLLIVTGCSDSSASGGGPDSGADSDSDSDSDSDTDTDTDIDTDTDTDSDSDSDSDGDTDTGTGDPWVAVDFTLLTYNVGNPDADDLYYPLRLQSQAYEDHMAAVLQELSPDVVVLQEVLSGKTCEAFFETDPDKTCYEWDTRPRPAVRLLGEDYSVVCDSREQVECIGVHVDFGQIDGVELGAYEEQGAYTPDLPLPECVWADGECTDELCDAESTVSAVTVHTAAGPLRVIHMHPMAQVSATVSGDPCRTDQLLQVFEGSVLDSEPPLDEAHDRAVIAGDWNLGLEVYWARTMFGSSDADEVWDAHVNCDDCWYDDLDPRNGFGVRYNTTSAVPSFLDDLGQPVAIDHVVVSDGVFGECAVHDAGGMDGTEPLDFEFDGLADLGEDERIDHYAISCDLTMDPSED